MNGDRYPSLGKDPRELRPKRANRNAALAVLAFIVIALALIALFG